MVLQLPDSRLPPKVNDLSIRSSLFYGNRDPTVRLSKSLRLTVSEISTRFHSPPEQYIPPVQEPYQYIIFRASEVKDLSVEDPAQGSARRTAHDDPAVIAVSFNADISCDEHNDGCMRAMLA